MKRSALTFLIFCVLMLTPWELSLASSPKSCGDWWVNAYGVISKTDYPFVSKAWAVFDRVVAAADKRSNRYPKLIIIRKQGNPWALALKDGTIILTKGALKICYDGVKEETGSARLAFVLGHEMAHLAKDDFWHLAAFETLQRFPPDQKVSDEIIDLLVKTEDIKDTVHAREIRKKKELQADSYGILYASMAGYDPNVIVNAKGKNFFEEWANQITKKIVYTDEFHPSPYQRAAFLLSNLAAVKADIDIFDLGVRLYQLGKYDDALCFLNSFKEKFPCREVFNNIGLVQYQKAMMALSEYDREKAYQYKLSTILDTETRARILRGANITSDVFEREIQNAITSFTAACQKDGCYIPARVNLSSALILADIYHEAMAVLKEALKIKKDDPKVLNNRAIAMYLVGPDIDVDMFEQAVRLLEDVIKKNPEFSDAFYNLGRLMHERARNSAARDAWGQYLNLESTGVYADMARENLGIKGSLTENQRTYSQTYGGPAPVKLGYLDKETKKQLKGFSVHLLKLGSISGKCYFRKGIRVLVLEGFVELVETPVTQKVSLSELNSMYGKPYRILAGPSGTKTLVYANFALDVKDGTITKVIYF